MLKKSLYFLFFTLFLFCLISCSGGSSGSKLEGVVILTDYVKGAEVFIDKNNNFIKDENDISAKDLTDENGKYFILGKDVYKYPVVARLTASSTDGTTALSTIGIGITSSSSTGTITSSVGDILLVFPVYEPLDENQKIDYKQIAISPISTILYSSSGGKYTGTGDNAYKAVQKNLNFESNILTDYVKANKGEINSSYKKFVGFADAYKTIYAKSKKRIYSAKAISESNNKNAINYINYYTAILANDIIKLTEESKATDTIVQKFTESSKIPTDCLDIEYLAGAKNKRFAFTDIFPSYTKLYSLNFNKSASNTDLRLRYSLYDFSVSGLLNLTEANYKFSKTIPSWDETIISGFKEISYLNNSDLLRLQIPVLSSNFEIFGISLKNLYIKDFVTTPLLSESSVFSDNSYLYKLSTYSDYDLNNAKKISILPDSAYIENMDNLLSEYKYVNGANSKALNLSGIYLSFDSDNKEIHFHEAKNTYGLYPEKNFTVDGIKTKNYESVKFDIDGFNFNYIKSDLSFLSATHKSLVLVEEFGKIALGKTQDNVLFVMDESSLKSENYSSKLLGSYANITSVTDLISKNTNEKENVYTKAFEIAKVFHEAPNISNSSFFPQAIAINFDKNSSGKTEGSFYVYKGESTSNISATNTNFNSYFLIKDYNNNALTGTWRSFSNLKNEYGNAYDGIILDIPEIKNEYKIGETSSSKTAQIAFKLDDKYLLAIAKLSSSSTTLKPAFLLKNSFSLKDTEKDTINYITKDGVEEITFPSIFGSETNAFLEYFKYVYSNTQNAYKISDDLYISFTNNTSSVTVYLHKAKNRNGIFPAIIDETTSQPLKIEGLKYYNYFYIPTYSGSSALLKSLSNKAFIIQDSMVYETTHLDKKEFQNIKYFFNEIAFKEIKAAINYSDVLK